MGYSDGPLIRPTATATGTPALDRTRAAGATPPVTPATRPEAPGPAAAPPASRPGAVVTPNPAEVRNDIDQAFNNSSAALADSEALNRLDNLAGALPNQLGGATAAAPVNANNAPQPNIFRNTLTRLLQDGVLNRQDLTELRTAASQVAPNSEDAQMAEGLMSYLDSLQETTQVNYTHTPAQGDPISYRFNYTPHYSESDLVAGSNAREQVSNISQNDTLSSTNDDGNRCGAASMLDAYLLTGGSFQSASSRLGVTDTGRQPMTYENVHRLQEHLFDRVNTDHNNSLSTGISYNFDANGNIRNARVTGEVATAASQLGLQATPLLGATRQTINQRQAAVEQFFQNQPNGVIQAGVHLDPDTGTVRPPTNMQDQNHYVLIFKQGEQYYMANTGVPSNGNGSAVRPLSAAEAEVFLNNHPGTVVGLSRPTP